MSAGARHREMSRLAEAERQRTADCTRELAAVAIQPRAVPWLPRADAQPRLVRPCGATQWFRPRPRPSVRHRRADGRDSAVPYAIDGHGLSRCHLRIASL